MIPALAPFVTLESACFQIHGRPFFAMEELLRLVLSLQFFLSSPFLPSIEYVRVEYRSREKPCFGFNDGTKWSVASCFNLAEFFVYLCTWVSFSNSLTLRHAAATFSVFRRFKEDLCFCRLRTALEFFKYACNTLWLSVDSKIDSIRFFPLSFVVFYILKNHKR